MEDIFLTLLIRTLVGNRHIDMVSSLRLEPVIPTSWTVWLNGNVKWALYYIHIMMCMPGVGLMVWVVGLGSSDPEFKSHMAVELIPGGVNSACHPPEVGKMSASMLVYCVGVATRPGLCPIAKETA